MLRFDKVQSALKKDPRTWLVTGVAGFIGSHLLEELLSLDQRVVGVDNFATGHRYNLNDVKTLVTSSQWSRFRLVEGDICDLSTCKSACAGVDFVQHQAGLGSVPRSLSDPRRSHKVNVTGFLNMLVAARDAKVRRFVYASSSSVYGDNPALPKVESKIGKPLSPYAATKLMDEIYADVFNRSYGLEVVGLRYFNVFGPRQDPEGAYAAVIPKWFAAILRGEDVIINGDGKTSRDFCYIANVVQANLLAATAKRGELDSQVYNVACGERTTLVQLYARIRSLLAAGRPQIAARRPVFRAERAGDVRHSVANIDLARGQLGYTPSHDVEAGLKMACAWYMRHAADVQ